MPPPPPPPPPNGPAKMPPQPPTPARAEATFNSALDHPTEEREAFIAQACGDDTVLIAEVQGLLAAHDGAGDFLKTDAAHSHPPQAPVEREGERIGRYKLLQQIGEGGFGTVWMAEQMEPVSRRVALKIIKLGMDTREVIARFEAERQALAMMDHPNIAKVLDAGATDKGRPFFVMELVKGMPITKYCDEAQLGTRERLALFGDVCSAIQHAHQKGVIHRDIKPSNVMVTLHGDKAVVKVIDFGIAKAIHSKLTDKTLFTRFDQFIGTPVYMSPEQASLSGLDIDTRSDIYALGILLYELLTGKPPFDAKSLISAGYEEMRRIIREVEPPKPSSRVSTMTGDERTALAKARQIAPEKLSRLVEPDLDWIVMKAIEKDRTRRYETANGLAQDIRNFLADEPVSATPPSAGYQFRKFVRRNRRMLVSGAVAGVALLAGLSVAGWVWLDSAWEKRDRLAVVEQQASTLIGEGERQMELNAQVPFENEANFPRAEEQVRRLESLVGFEQAGAELRARKAGLVASVAREGQDRALIARIETALMKEMKGLGSPKTKKSEDMANAFHQSELNPEARSADAIVAAITARREALRERLLVGLVAWADSLAETEPDKAARLNAIIDRCDSDPWRQALRKAVAAGDGAALDALADSPELSRQPTMTVLRLSSALQKKQLAGVVEKLLRRAQREAPASFWTNFYLGMALAGGIDRPAGGDASDLIFENRLHFGKAAPGTATPTGAVRPEFTEAIGFLRAAAAARPDADVTWFSLGLALSAGAQWDEAIACYRRGLDLAPGEANAHLALATAYIGGKRPEEAVAAMRKAMELGENGRFEQMQLGMTLAQLGRYEEALGFLQKACEQGPGSAKDGLKIEGVELHRGDPAQALGVARYFVGVQQIARGDWDDGVTSLRRAIEAIPECPRAHLALGVALWQKGEPAAAIPSFRRAIELTPALAEAHNGLGIALLQTGDRTAGVASLREAIRLNPADAEAQTNLGMALCQMGKMDEAFTFLKKAVELNPVSALAWSNLGAALDRQGKLEEAAAAFRKAIAADPNYAPAQRNLAIVVERLGKSGESTDTSEPVPKTNSDEATAQMERGRTLGKEGKFEEAAAAFRRAIALDPKLAKAHRGLALMLVNLDKKEEAAKAIRVAIQLDPKDADAQMMLGGVLLDLGKFAEAVAACRAAIALDPKSAAAHSILGSALSKQGKFDEAVTACRIAIQLGGVPALTHGILGGALAKLGRFDEAVEAYHAALKLDPKFSAVQSYLAFFNKGAADRNQGPEKWEEVLKLSRAVHGPEHPHTLGTMTDLAMAYGETGRLTEAIPLQEQALTIKRRVLPKDHPFLAIAMENLADLYEKSGRTAEALRQYEELLTLRRKVLGPENPVTLEAMSNLADSYSTAGRNEEALKLKEEVLALRRKVLGPEHPDTLGAMTNLAKAYGKTGRLAEAIPLQEQALTIKRRVLPNNHHFLGFAMANLADLYDKSGRNAEALQQYEELLSFSRKTLGAAHPDTLSVMPILSVGHLKAGHLQELGRLIAEQIEYLLRAGKGLDSELSQTFQKQLASLAADLTKGPAQEDAITRYYTEHQDAFRENSVRLHMITINREAGKEARDAQRQKAEALRQKIADGTPFAAVAREYSEEEKAMAAPLYASLIETLPVNVADGSRWVMDKGDAFPVILFKEDRAKVVLQLAGTSFVVETKQVNVFERKHLTAEGWKGYQQNVKTYNNQRTEREKKAAALNQRAGETLKADIRKDGGDRGTVERGDLREDLDKVIFTMKQGTPTIHEDDDHLWIFQVDDRKEGSVAPLEKVQEKISNILREQKRTELIQKWQRDARKKVELEAPAKKP